jgi:uncharacterized RDD family membrane protein YckC
MINRRVGFEPRFTATLIDAVAMGAVSAVAGFAMGSVFGAGAGATTGGATGDEGAAALAGMLGFAGGVMAGVLLSILAYGLIEGLTGASPGKRALKLTIGTEDGRPAPVATCLLRWAVKNLNPLLMTLGVVSGFDVLNSLGKLAGFVILIGCFLVLGEGRQALHDLAAKTAVFKRGELT